jgi:hypothetical protein
MSFQSFQSLATSKLKFGGFMLMKLPSAFFCGVRLRRITEEEAITSVPYKWLSQNPFNSIYFACQAMAAELSTGVLAIGHLYNRKPAVSMLVTQLRATYTKKATERIYFTCSDGGAIKAAIAQAIESGEGQTIDTISVGRTANGDLVSEFVITWSFKAKT